MMSQKRRFAHLHGGTSEAMENPEPQAKAKVEIPRIPCSGRRIFSAQVHLAVPLQGFHQPLITASNRKSRRDTPFFKTRLPSEGQASRLRGFLASAFLRRFLRPFLALGAPAATGLALKAKRRGILTV